MKSHLLASRTSDISISNVLTSLDGGLERDGAPYIDITSSTSDLN